MFAIKSIVVKPNDTYTTVSGLYTGSTVTRALAQHKAHVQQLHGYKLYLRNTIIEEVNQNS